MYGSVWRRSSRLPHPRHHQNSQIRASSGSYRESVATGGEHPTTGKIVPKTGIPTDPSVDTSGGPPSEIGQPDEVPIDNILRAGLPHAEPIELGSPTRCLFLNLAKGEAQKDYRGDYPTY